jgi:TetR/AcrR family transcriptional repressor of nem operon
MPRKSNRRELIIDIATNRFLISGYDVVTVDELCELSSSTKGSFYHFFENKEALAVDVVNQVWHNTQSEMNEIFINDFDPIDQLSREVDRIAGSYLRFDGKRYYVGCPIGTLAVSLRGKSLKLSRRLNFALTHMRQYYVDAFEQARSTGYFSDASTGKLADQFQIGLQGISTLGKALQNNTRIRELAAAMQDTLR